MLAIDAGADDIVAEEDNLVIFSSGESLSNIKKVIESEKISYESAEVELIPANPIKIEDKKMLGKLEKLMGALDEQEDVNEIYSNLLN